MNIDRTFQLRHYPLDKMFIRCIKCGHEGRFDKAALIDKLGRDHPVWSAVDRLTKDWECSQPDVFKNEALRPSAQYCRPSLPEFEALVRQFHVDVNHGRKPSVTLYLRDEPQPVSKA